ncbi:MAG: hypothetical protein MI861_25470 [Pirellulales bacterium]|nr:hypothetical protein [Pirellulales bacterium]
MKSELRTTGQIAELRLQRLQSLVGPVEIEPVGWLETPTPLIGITSSRLGRDPQRHHLIGRFLARSVQDCDRRSGTILVAQGSAIDPWTRRAAELFAVPLRRFSVNGKTAAGEIKIRSRSGGELSRDQVLIALADRVEATYVRRGGMIEHYLRQRLSLLKDGSTRVAVSRIQPCAANGLIDAGAVGWLLAGNDNEPALAAGPFSPAPPSNDDRPNDRQPNDDWTRAENGRWLVHCTRGCSGAWPGETQRQYMDALLLGHTGWPRRAPLDALLRIVRSGRLLAGGRASRKTQPVVCFSAVPLRQLLTRRCFRSHLGRWDYEPYGVALRREAAESLGAQQVIYGKPQQLTALQPADQFRFHPVGRTFDWQQEQEWRIPHYVELNRLDQRDVRVFVDRTSDYQYLSPFCRWPITVLRPE